MKTCPNCAKTIDGLSTTCWSCGTVLGDALAPPAASAAMRGSATHNFGAGPPPLPNAAATITQPGPYGQPGAGGGPAAAPAYGAAFGANPVAPRSSGIPGGLVLFGFLLLLGAAVSGAWFLMEVRGNSSSEGLGVPIQSGTEIVSGTTPRPGLGLPTADGWLNYRTPDGQFLFELPAAPAAPVALPSSSSIQMAYSKVDGGRVGFGWSAATLSPDSDVRATLEEIMNGVLLSRGAQGVAPSVIEADGSIAISANVDLVSGRAIFIVTEIEGRPVVAMVIAALGEPDSAIANRMISSFRPAP